MIIVKLMGGLGNQCFNMHWQRNLSLKNNTELVFDFERFKRGGRQYCLDCFNLQYRPVGFIERCFLVSQRFFENNKIRFCIEKSLDLMILF